MCCRQTVVRVDWRRLAATRRRPMRTLSDGRERRRRRRRHRNGLRRRRRRCNRTTVGGCFTVGHVGGGCGAGDDGTRGPNRTRWRRLNQTLVADVVVRSGSVAKPPAMRVNDTSLSNYRTERQNRFAKRRNAAEHPATDTHTTHIANTTGRLCNLVSMSSPHTTVLLDFLTD